MSSHTNASSSLAIACRDGHYVDALYLLEKCHADIEQVDLVTLDGTRINGATPLWCAAAAGHLDIVKLLVNYKASVNSFGKINSSALQAACFYGHFEIAKYLIQFGADIELATRCGLTCLMIACYEGHYEICKYLVECGASVNSKTVDGSTALHGSAESGSMKILKLLLENGAKFDCDSCGTTPLLSAATAGHVAIVQYFIQEFDCTKYDKINALELLGAILIDENSNMVMALDYWQRAMRMRYEDKEHPLEKPIAQSPIASYVDATEVRTFLQLDDLKSQPDEMRMQALLVKERILGPDHLDTIYYVKCMAATYASNDKFDISIRLFVYALDNEKKIREPLSPITRRTLINFVEYFSYMMPEALEFHAVSFRCILQVFEGAVKDIESALDFTSQKLLQDLNETDQFHRTLIIAMHLIGLMCQLQLYLDESEELQFKKSVYRLVQMNPRSQNGCTLLHLACCKDTSTLGQHFRSAVTFPSSEVVDLLLEVGAHPNELDLHNNTPLHIAAINKPCSRTIFKSLLNYGAHLDICNLKKQTPLQLAQCTHNVMDLYPLKYINLHCLCAKVVQSNGIPYKGYVHKILEVFIDFH